MKYYQLSFFFIFNLFLGALYSQEQQTFYAVQYEESPQEKVFLQFHDIEIMQLPLVNEQVLSAYSEMNGILYLTSFNDIDSLSSIWQYNASAGTIKRILSLKMKIVAFAIIEDGIECILRKQKKTYLLRKYFSIPGSYNQPLHNEIHSVFYQDINKRITVDKARQLASTDSTYQKFKLLNNHVGKDIYKTFDNKITFIHKYSDEFWYLKEFSPEDMTSQIIVRMPQGIDNYIITQGGNFLCYDKSRLFTFNPRVNCQWTEIPLPMDCTHSVISWLRFLSDSTIIFAFNRVE